MAREQKPYRVYRGGRVKGKVPTPRARAVRARRDARDAAADGRRDSRTEYRGVGARSQKDVRWGRRIGIGLLVLLLLVVVWAVASWFAFSSGVSDANKRLDPNAKSALTDQSGLLLPPPPTTPLPAPHTARGGAGGGDRHSDSILLLRTDPSHHRLYYLSIPRDLQVPIPGSSTQKVNAAFQIGGPALAIRTIRQLTGTDVNHVVVVNFADFKDLIDALGGIDVNVPKPIRSNRFDCPFATQARCSQWQGWRFAKGNQHMNGERALIYSRIRENMLDPSENDVTRGARQQQVMDALASKFTSPGTLVKLPFDGGSLATPLTTDLSGGQLVQLGWAKF